MITERHKAVSQRTIQSYRRSSKDFKALPHRFPPLKGGGVLEPYQE